MPNASQSLGPRSRNQQDSTFAGMSVMTIHEGRIVVDFWKPDQDILEKLIPLAEEEGILCIMAARGFVSYVEFLNRQGAPVPVHRDFQIKSLEGNIVYPKKNGKNLVSWANVLLDGEDGLLGGPVKSLITKSHVQVILSTIDKSVDNEEYSALLNYMELRDRFNKAMDELYEETLKYLNQW